MLQIGRRETFIANIITSMAKALCVAGAFELKPQSKAGHPIGLQRFIHHRFSEQTARVATVSALDLAGDLRQIGGSRPQSRARHFRDRAPFAIYWFSANVMAYSSWPRMGFRIRLVITAVLHAQRLKDQGLHQLWK